MKGDLYVKRFYICKSNI